MSDSTPLNPKTRPFLELPTNEPPRSNHTLIDFHQRRAYFRKIGIQRRFTGTRPGRVKNVNVTAAEREIRLNLYERMRNLNENGQYVVPYGYIMSPLPENQYHRLLKQENERYKEDLHQYNLFRKVHIRSQCRIPLREAIDLDNILIRKYLFRFKRDLGGMIYAFDNVKVQTDVVIVDYSRFYTPVWVEFDAYVFTPMAGIIGLGVVEAKGDDIIQLSWYGMATVFLYKADNPDFWDKYDEVTVGCGIYFLVNRISGDDWFLHIHGRAIFSEELVYDKELLSTTAMPSDAEEKLREHQIYEFSESEDSASEISSSSSSSSGGSSSISSDKENSDEEMDEIEDVEPESVEMETSEEDTNDDLPNTKSAGKVDRMEEDSSDSASTEDSKEDNSESSSESSSKAKSSHSSSSTTSPIPKDNTSSEASTSGDTSSSDSSSSPGKKRKIPEEKNTQRKRNKLN